MDGQESVATFSVLFSWTYLAERLKESLKS